MKVYAIGDLHLSINNPKPMDIFGGAWDDYVARIEADWRARVSDGDAVLIPGDISWAMTLANALPDLQLIAALPGRKVILRGNHDYWWNSVSALRAALPAGMYAVQNDAVRFGNFDDGQPIKEEKRKVLPDILSGENKPDGVSDTLSGENKSDGASDSFPVNNTSDGVSVCNGVVICGSRCWTTPETEGVFPSENDKKIYLREGMRLKMSLDAANKLRRAGDRVICMTHYPPFNSRREESDFTRIISEGRADACVYGHLHGRSVRRDLRIEKGGVPYYLTSCDLADNKLVRIF
jgi:predicted phosphohydrolase